MTTISAADITNKELTSAEAKDMTDVQRADIINQILTGQNSMYKPKIEELNGMESKIEFSKWCVYADNLKSGNFYAIDSRASTDPRTNPNFLQFMRQEGLESVYDPIDKRWYTLGEILQIFSLAYEWFKGKQHEYDEDREAFAAAYRNTKEMQITGKLYSLVYLWGKFSMMKKKETGKDLKAFISAIRKYFQFNVEKYESIYRSTYNFNNIGYSGQAITCVKCPVPNVSDADIIAANELRQSLNTIINNLRLLFITSDKPINICLNNAVLGTLQNNTNANINIEQKVNCVIEQKGDKSDKVSADTSMTPNGSQGTNGGSSGTSGGSSGTNGGPNSHAPEGPPSPNTAPSNQKNQTINVIIGITFLITVVILVTFVIIHIKRKHRDSTLAPDSYKKSNGWLSK